MVLPQAVDPAERLSILCRSVSILLVLCVHCILNMLLFYAYKTLTCIFNQIRHYKTNELTDKQLKSFAIKKYSKNLTFVKPTKIR